MLLIIQSLFKALYIGARFNHTMNSVSEKRKTTDQQSGANKKSKTETAPFTDAAYEHVTSWGDKEALVVPHCTNGKLLFSEDIKDNSGMKKFHAMTWKEVHTQVCIGKATKKYRHLYELRTPGKKCVLYFDIDGKVKQKTDHNSIKYLNDFEQVVREVLGIDSKMRVQDACGTKGNYYKVSYHILFPDVHFESHTHLKHFIEDKGRVINKTNTAIGDFVADTSVYAKGSWRMPYCTKKGSTRVSVPQDVENFTLQAFKELSIHFVPETSILIEVQLVAVSRRTVSRKRKGKSLAFTSGTTTCPLLKKAQKHFGVSDNFESVGLTKCGQGVIYKRRVGDTHRCWNMEHTTHKRIKVCSIFSKIMFPSFHHGKQL